MFLFAQECNLKIQLPEEVDIIVNFSHPASQI